jgi:hypothetical protein
MPPEISEKDGSTVVADMAECDTPATQEVTEAVALDSSSMRAAAIRWWPDVPCASGGEIAWALRHVGLEARIGGPDHVVLMRGHAPVATVPLRHVMHPAIVRALLSTLGITPEQLTEYMADP